MSRICVEVRVRGIVQGVGFRPFCHKAAQELNLCGFVRNSSDGAELALEGAPGDIRAFIDRLRDHPPAAAVVESVETVHCALRNYQDFSIARSLTLPLRDTLISPDLCLCADCRREMNDPGDRRYRYPFINCTNCGPRFTIIRDVPYDRPFTSMAGFPMCPACEKEYNDINDRRYHAQPVSCPDCGPRLLFYDGSGRLIAQSRSASGSGDPLGPAIRLLEEGGILAVKGLGGIHLSCRAGDADAVRMLRHRKQRDARPFALMCRDLAAIRRLAEVTPQEEALLTGPQHPIVLLRRKDPEALSDVTDNAYLGIMLPYTPLHELLLSDGPDTLVMTSANLSDRPILCDNEAALRELSGIADGFLLNDREIAERCDDSVCFVENGRSVPVRRSRGYAPFPLSLSEPVPSVLAFGAEQKASFCFSRGRHVFPSQHIGDLKNAETLAFYEERIAHYEQLFDFRPEVLVCDLHPDYLSTETAGRLAAARGLPLHRVQHHHAHLVSALADAGLPGPAQGIIWDGTGLGTDGTVWGGEFLTGDASGFERRASLRPFLLPGGDAAVREIFRVGISLLADVGIDAAPFYDPETVHRIKALRALPFAAPVTTSMGRLFDGTASLLGLCRAAGYEGQGAVLLEYAAERALDASFGGDAALCQELLPAYPFSLIQAGPEEARGTLPSGRLLIDERPAVRALCEDILRGVPAGHCALRFHLMVSEAAAAVCFRLYSAGAPKTVVLSGGCFQNRLLLKFLPEKLRRLGLMPVTHRRVPPNDEGISLGQLCIAAAGGLCVE